MALSPEAFPVGKVDFIFLQPMDFREFLIAFEEQNLASILEKVDLNAEIPQFIHNRLWDYLKLYFVSGGMPEAVQALVQGGSANAALSQVRKIQRAILLSYEQDFSKLAGRLNANHLQSIFRNIPLQLANTMDDSTKRFQFNDIMSGKKGFTTWQRPISWLLNAGLAIQIKIANYAGIPLEHYCKQNLFKLFPHDVGLLGCMLGLEPENLLSQNYGIAKGYFAECYVAQSMRSVESDYEQPLYSWSEGESQIEFVRSYHGSVIPIEVKAGHRVKAKSLQQFRLRYDPPLTIKVSANPLNYQEEQKHLNLPLYLSHWAQVVRE